MTVERHYIVRRRLRLRQLRALRHAARLASMSAAARHPGVGSEAASRRVLEHEHEPRESLFELEDAGVAMRAPGEPFAPLGAPLVERMQQGPALA